QSDPTDPVEVVAAAWGLKVEKDTVPSRNWNAEWEAGFEPVIIADQVMIRAHFHPAPGGSIEDILITPKMSFGTGHHATTRLMVEGLLRLDVRDRSVLDFGTGTGVLAILAAKREAARIHAIDNDPWSMENARENLQRNSCERVLLETGSVIPSANRYDIILANINRNVLLEQLAAMATALTPGGRVLISGFLEADTRDLEEAAHTAGLQRETAAVHQGWVCLQLSKS
ncbi:MAG: hypothetical protein RJA57_493, partial [Bacteroidota bacterium]